jgi:hypothetical protein
LVSNSTFLTKYNIKNIEHYNNTEISINTTIALADLLHLLEDIWVIQDIEVSKVYLEYRLMYKT